MTTHMNNDKPLGIDHSHTNSWSAPQPIWTPLLSNRFGSRCICTLPSHNEYRQDHTHGDVFQCIVPGCNNGTVLIPTPKSIDCIHGHSGYPQFIFNTPSLTMYSHPYQKPMTDNIYNRQPIFHMENN